MNKYFLVSHPDVESDYSDAYHWYELQQQGLGEKLLKQVRKKVDEISVSPETYSTKGKKGYREAKIEGFPYLIVYKIYPKQRSIFISAIHHEKRDPRKKYRKL